MWVKFWKTWRNGGNCHDYIYFDDQFLKNDFSNNDETKDFIKEKLEEWAESVGGGFSYGYKYGFDEISCPPEEWIRKEISETEKSIKYYSTIYLERKKEYKKMLESLIK